MTTLQTHSFNNFHIHGDNIVECERAINLIKCALLDDICDFHGPYGSPVCPSYRITLKKSVLFFTLYPGFGRWNHDILNLIRKRGGTLREAADVIITGVSNGNETPLVAIEYCSALPAGNQAWQRSGRAYSFGKAQVPYLYIAELSGYELGQERVRKAARLPNPAVPFSYVAFSMTNNTPTYPIYITSPGADEISRIVYENVFSEPELAILIRGIIFNQSNKLVEDAIRFKALNFVETKASASRLNITLTPDQWQKAYEALEQGQSLVNFLVTNTQISWSKTSFIPITQTARYLMNFTSTIAIGLTSSQLPMCIVPRESRKSFADVVSQLYKGRIQNDFITWLRQDRHLSICWVMGFKPRHDDARPDRGLPPFTRMLIGENSDLLTVIYGPAPTSAWKDLHVDPQKLMQSNGLWEAILGVSDAILADSLTDNISHQGYLKSHWHKEQPQHNLDLVLVKPIPSRFGENDVDTVIHLLLAHYGKNFIFEGMCNPPGGDWSGISLMQPDGMMNELRWLTLPRVSSGQAKRPDHVFQLFIPNKLPIILLIESKDRARDVEANIGERLINYIKTLLYTPASIERTSKVTSWTHSVTNLNINFFTMASAAAFISDTEINIENVANRAEVDILMCFTFSNLTDCTIRLIPITPLGYEIEFYIKKISLQEININVV